MTTRNDVLMGAAASGAGMMVGRGNAMASLVLASGLLGVPAAGGSEQAEHGPEVLQPSAFQYLPLGQLRPTGWLREQLKTQAAGLSGHLDEFWPDLKDSAWIGGKAEGWERVPYWLDGMVPLAYLLDDPALQAKVKRFVDYILAHQRPDGWLGPIGDSAGHKAYDPWPLFPLFKALTQYQEATGDPRVIPALLRCAHKIGEVIDQTPLYSWGKMRAADLAVSLYWLHDRSGEAWLLELARKTFAQSHDWRRQYQDFKFTARTRDKFDLDTHGVNTAMALKYGGVRLRLTGEPADQAAVYTMLDLLDQYHGQATGIFTCDEHLAGRSPAQGTELCTVVEAMYSLEVLAAIQWDTRLGDRLERLAYSALPATFKKDMTAHQYDQQCNQVICTKSGDHVYVNNNADSNLYGLEPNFGCCTANLHQGWPKFAASLWLRAQGGLAVLAYAPCVFETRVKDKPVKVEVATEYPFRDTVQIVVTASEAVRFPLTLRVPRWCKRAVLRDQAGKILAESPAGVPLVLDNEWKDRVAVMLEIASPVRLYHGFNDSVAIERGPLVYALPIGTEWKKVKDNAQFADWEVYPTTPWNYALEIDRAHPERSVSFQERPIGPAPFSVEGAPVLARVKGRRLPGWGLEKSAAAPPPPSPVTGSSPLEELTLLPYGCTDLRVTEFPTVEKP
jgi:hypothetical protein